MSKFQRIYWSNKFDWNKYSKIYNDYCKTKKNYYSESAQVLVNSIDLSEKLNVVDLACGTGALTNQLLKKYEKINIFAIDLSKDMLKFYKENFKDQIKNGQIKAISGNAEILNKYTKDKFDIVFITCALWDLEIEETLKNIFPLLKQNGKIVFNLPALVVEKERGFIFFIEHFFRQSLNSDILYRRIKMKELFDIFNRQHYNLVSLSDYSFNLTKKNVEDFFDLLRYRYPFILFPESMPYEEKLEKCTKTFIDSLRYVPKDGISEEGVVFVIQKND